MLIVRDGFDASQLSAAGYAEYHPIAGNHTAEGRAMNRRVDIVILGRGLAAAAVAQAETPGGAKGVGRAPKPSPNIPRDTSYNTNSR